MKKTSCQSKKLIKLKYKGSCPSKRGLISVDCITLEVFTILAPEVKFFKHFPDEITFIGQYSKYQAF